MKYILLICARGGSNGLPGKNIKQLNGVPLIVLSINIAKKINRASRIIVSTDSEEIAATAIEFGAEVPFIRPAFLGNDVIGILPVMKNALDWLDRNNSNPKNICNCTIYS